jgi:Domain of unknown function (DUF4129)
VKRAVMAGVLLGALAGCGEGPDPSDEYDGGLPGPVQIVREVQGQTKSVPPPDSGQPLPSPAQAVRSVLGHRQFQFCHEPSYPLTPAEKRWCDLGAANSTQACPKIRDACNNDALAKQLELREPTTFRLPDLGLPVRLLLWILIGVGLGMLIFALVRHFLDHKTKEAVVRTQSAGSAEQEVAAALARQVETDVQRLLERARSEAAAGDFRGAIGSAYAALLRRLEGAGIVQIAPDQTNGDYVRRIKSDQPSLAGRMEEVVDSVEHAQFGEHVVTASTFERVLAGVTSLLAERLVLLLFVAGLSLLGTACGQPRDDWEHSPSGRAGVVQFLTQRGFKVHERLLSLAKINDSKVEQIVLLPGAQVGDDEWKALRAWILESNHALVIAGGQHTLPDWIGMRTVPKQDLSSQPMRPTQAEVKRWGDLQVRVPESNRLECKPSHAIVLSYGQVTYAAETWTDDDDDSSRVLVLADDFLFRNASLLVADNAAMLDNLLRDGGMSIEWVGDLAGLVSTNPVQSVGRGRLGPAMLQLAAFLLIFFVGVGARFGRPVPSERLQRREFVEHVRALGLHYARARGERHALGLFGVYAVERLRERLGLRVDRSLSGLAEAVATRTGRSVGEVMRTLLEARDASKGVPAEAGAHDLDTTAELVRMLEETGGSGGHKRIQDHV